MKRWITTAVGIGALVAVLAAGSAGSPVAGDATPPGTDVASEHRRIVDFWTAERRASAIPREVILPSPAARPDNAGKGNGKGPNNSTTTTTPDSTTTTTADSTTTTTTASTTTTTTLSTTTTTTGSTVVGGAPWTGGGDVAVTTGRVFFTLNGTRYTCSGSAVASSHGNLVSTAGHCVHAGGGGAFATDWVFYPGYRNGPHPTLGAWTATDIFTTTAWATTSGAYADDAAFVVVTGGPARGTLAAALQATDPSGVHLPVPVFSLSTHLDSTYYAFGYPAAKKYNGSVLVYCAGPVRERYDNRETLALGCDMTGGSSGGPWLREFGDGTSRQNSLNSYGYQSLKNVMFGPIFDAAEHAAYAAADVTPDCDTAAATGYRCVDLADPAG